MEKRKPRIGIVSNCPIGGKTGLGRNIKSILPHLYNTNKYDIFFLAQGMQNNDINFLKLPFKCEGVFNNFDQQRFHQDPNYQRLVAYGNTSIENFVINNKLDCLVLSDDQWAFNNDFYLNKDWFKYMEKNILPVITADSLPLLPQIVEWAEKVPNMSFWSKFPLKHLKEKESLKSKKFRVIYGSLDIDKFKPLEDKERLELRRKFNIEDDEKIILYLGRNQLRKIFASNIEALAKFKQEYPNKKVRLLFHTSFSEPMGWPIDQIRQQNNLDKNDILCTYYCQNCHNWDIQPFEGEQLDCKCCNSQKTRLTAGIGSTITESDLNKIYNIADGSASIFTSGSFEYTNAESMLSGVPLAVPNYVCGEDFLESTFVKEIKGYFTYEHNTGFKKFVPDINSIIDFYNFIYDLSNKDKKILIHKARNWAINKFDSKIIAKQYEDFFDSCELVDWDIFLKNRNKPKNLNIQISQEDFNIKDNKEFIKLMYLKILDMKVEDSDSGLSHWQKYLSQEHPQEELRKSLINSFISAAQEHNNKIMPQKSLDDLLDKSGKKRLGLVMPESIGDIFLISSLFKSIRKRYPKNEWAFHFITKPEYFELLDCNNYIDKLIPYSQEFDNLLFMEGHGNHKGYFDILYVPHLGTQRLLDWTHNNCDIHDLNLRN